MRSVFVSAATAAFILGATATSAAVITVNIPEPSGGNFDYFGAGDASVTYDGVIFSTSSALSDGLLFNVGTAFSGEAFPVVSSQSETSGVGNLLITLPSLAKAISVTYGTFNGTSVTFALSNGSTGAFASTGGGYATPDVYNSGLQTAFGSLQLTTGIGDYLQISSLTYTTDDGQSAVPEPASWAMMVGGFGLIGGALRRRQRTSLAFG
jgi:hypothetical protein